MKWSAAIAILGLGGAMTAPADLLHTLDGRVLSGRIELRPGPALHIQGPAGSHQILLAQVRLATFGDHTQTHSGLRNLRAEVYRGKWLALPDFSKLKPTAATPLAGNRLTLQPHNALAGYALVFNGDLLSPAKGVYQFFLGSDDGARLLVGGKTIIDNDGRHGLRYRQGQIELAAGRHDFRLEYFNHAAAALLHLDWSGPGLPRNGLSTTGVITSASPAMRPDELAICQPGVLAWGGSFIPHPVIAADTTKITFSGDRENLRLSTINTSALFFSPVTIHHAQALRNGRPGLLMRDGKFVEGKFISLKDNHVMIQSVLFGKKTLPVESQVAAIFLRPPAKTLKQIMILTRDGAVLAATRIKIENNALLLDAPPYLQHRVPRVEIQSLWRGKFSNPLANAWAKWDQLDAGARRLLQSRESALFNAANQAVSTRGQEAVLLRQVKLANESLAAARIALGENQRVRLLAENNATRAKSAMEKASADNSAKLLAVEAAKSGLAIAKNAVTASARKAANAKAAHVKARAIEQAELKKARNALALLKTSADKEIAASAARVKQAREKAAADLKAAGAATTNRVNALASLALARRRLTMTTTKMDAINKARATAEPLLKTASAATPPAQAGMTRAQTDLTTKKTALNTARIALNTAITTRQTPAKANLATMEKVLAQAMTAKGHADQALATIQGEVATALLKKNNLAGALMEITKLHGGKQQKLSAASVAMAKAGQDAITKRQRANALREALENIVNTRQAPALASYTTATNQVAQGTLAKAKANELLASVQAETKIATTKLTAAVKAATDAEATNKVIQADPKKLKPEKDAARKEADTLRQAATTAKTALANLQSQKLLPVQKQVTATTQALVTARSILMTNEKNLTNIGNEITRATQAFVGADTTAQAAERKALGAVMLRAAAMMDLELATQRMAGAKAKASAATTAHGTMVTQKEAPAQAVVKSAIDAVAKATGSKTKAAQALTAANGEVAKTQRALTVAQAQDDSAGKTFAQAGENLKKASDLQAQKEADLKELRGQAATAATAKTKADTEVKQLEAAVKKATDDELVKLKPLADSRAALEIELEMEQALKARKAGEIKEAMAALKTLMVDLAKQATAADKTHKESLQANTAALKTEMAAGAKIVAAQAAATVVAETLKQSQQGWTQALKVLTEQSRVLTETRAQANALQAQQTLADLALEKFRLDNRAQLAPPGSGR